MNCTLKSHTAIILIINANSNYSTFIKITAKWWRSVLEFVFNKQVIATYLLLDIPKVTPKVH